MRLLFTFTQSCSHVVFHTRYGSYTCFVLPLTTSSLFTLLRFQFHIYLSCLLTQETFLPLRVDLSKFCPLINISYGCQSTRLVSVSNNQQRKVTTWLFILFLHQSPRLSPYTVQTHPSLSAMTVLYNMRLYSLYLPFLALSLCIPASFPRYPSHTSPPANIYVERERGREKKRTEQFQTRRHKPHIQRSLFSVPSRRTSLLYSSVRQCPRPHRNGFFPLEHEKDCQIIRNPTSPTEPPA